MPTKPSLGLEKSKMDRFYLKMQPYQAEILYDKNVQALPAFLEAMDQLQIPVQHITDPQIVDAHRNLVAALFPFLLMP